MLAFVFNFDAMSQHSEPYVLVMKPLFCRSHRVCEERAVCATLVLAVCFEALHRRLVDHATHAAFAACPRMNCLAHCFEKLTAGVVVRRLAEILDCGFVESMLCFESEACGAFESGTWEAEII